MVITASQIQWTTNVTKALLTCKDRGDSAALKSIKKKQVPESLLNPVRPVAPAQIPSIRRHDHQMCDGAPGSDALLFLRCPCSTATLRLSVGTFPKSSA